MDRDRTDDDIVLDKLRHEACDMLQFDAAKLSAWQEARAGTLSLLLLQQDRLTQMAVAGQDVDPRQVVAIGTQLEAVLRPVAADHNNVFERERDNEAARAKLAELVAGIVEQREHDADEIAEREERVMAWEAANEQTPLEIISLKPPAAASPAARTTYTECLNNQPAPPAEPSVLRHTSLHNSGQVPSHYLKGPDEPWRPFVSESGIDTGGRGTAPLKRDWGARRGW